MRTLLAALSFCIAAAAFAGNAPASEASVRTLIELSGHKQIFDQAFSQLDAKMQKTFAKGDYPPEFQVIFDRMRGKLVALAQKELGWERMEPLLIGIYRDIFSADEIAAITAHYQSRAGKSASPESIPPEVKQSIAQKIPQVQQKIEELKQESLRDLMAKLAVIQGEALIELIELRLNAREESAQD